MSEEMAFYTSPMSRRRMVHWMLEEVGARYPPHLLSLDKSEQRAPQYLAINPMGKVPAMKRSAQVRHHVGNDDRGNPMTRVSCDSLLK